MKPETIQEIGRLADKADNLAAAASIPMPPDFHVGQLRVGLEAIARDLKAVYMQETGENPWEGEQ